jgi:hypothetical protein
MFAPETPRGPQGSYMGPFWAQCGAISGLVGPGAPEPVLNGLDYDLVC